MQTSVDREIVRATTLLTSLDEETYRKVVAQARKNRKINAQNRKKSHPTPWRRLLRALRRS